MFKTFLVATLSMFLLTGCLAGLTDQQTGNTVTTVYDSQGKVISTTNQEKAVGDKYTGYSDAAIQVSRSSAQSVVARVSAVAQAMAPIPGEDPIASAYRQAMGMMALSNINDITPEAIQSLHYGKDGYDVGSDLVGVIPGVTTGVIAFKGLDVVSDVMTSALRESGDSTTVSAGDGNTIQGFNKEEVDAEIHATAIGENSNPSVNQPNVNTSGGTGGASPVTEEINPEDIPEDSRCRDDASCSSGETCSKQDGSVGQCLPY